MNKINYEENNDQIQNIVVLRIGHRPLRDKRITTHVALTARALGANGFLLNSNDPNLIKNINCVTERFGGNFFALNNVNAVEEIIKWKKNGGMVCHLSMYGMSFPNLLSNIKKERKIMIIVGAEKVSFEYYKLANWNVSIGNQPHSEVAALAIFLDRYFNPLVDPLLMEFTSPKLTVVPSKLGKVVIKK